MRARPSLLIAISAGMLAAAPIGVAAATAASEPTRLASTTPVTSLVNQARPYPAYLAIDLRGLEQLLPPAPSPPPPPPAPKAVLRRPAAPAPVAGAVRVASVKGLIWPVQGPIMSPYGARGGRTHEGLDIDAPTGRPVQAAAAGEVVYAGVMSGYGNLVEVRHGSGLSTRYAHLSRIDVRVGQSVDQGLVVGAAGMTGRTSAPHLHFEVRIGGVAQNPLGYLP